MPVRAVGIGNASELIDCADECADEEKVDEGDEVGGMASARIQEERSEGPYCSQHRHYEQDEDRARREPAACVVVVDEPGEHAQRGDQGDDLENPPEPKGQS